MPHTTFRRLLGPLLPALAAACVFGAVSESSARERCTSKPAVCARLATAERTRGVNVERPLAYQSTTLATSTAAAPRCTSKPAVCARLASAKSWRSSPPVTVAAYPNQGARCITKPAVCARLERKPGRAPLTLATAAP